MGSSRDNYRDICHRIGLEEVEFWRSDKDGRRTVGVHFFRTLAVSKPEGYRKALLMEVMTNLDEKYMQVCVELANIALSAGDPPVGAILVHGDRIIGRGIESGRSTGDITNHAEILAVRDAVNNGHSELLCRAILYTTHEPCIMCSYVIRQSKIPGVVFGVAVSEGGGYTSEFAILKTNKIGKWGKVPQITSGVCASECEKLNEIFRAARMNDN